MRNRRVWVLGVLFVGLAGSCDDEETGGSCTELTPCGGEVVGTWEVTDFCIASDLKVDSCPGATTSFEGVAASGTVTYNADMTSTGNVTTKGSVVMNIPGSCLVGVSCAQVDSALQDSDLIGPESAYSAVACTGSGGCTCTLTLRSDAMMSTGTWSTSGNQLIDQDGESSDYCASDNELRLRSAPSTSGAVDGLRFGVRLTRK